MATNVKSVWMALHHALPRLKARGGGSVINVILRNSVYKGQPASGKWFGVMNARYGGSPKQTRMLAGLAVCPCCTARPSRAT